MASSSANLTLKLLIDTKRDKVLFAEASKSVVDFFLNLLCLPISSVIRLLSKNEMVGCLGNLYESVENLNDTYMQPDTNKDVLLKPIAPISSAAISGLLPSNVNRSDKREETKFYRCPCHDDYVTCNSRTICPIQYCGNRMTSEMKYVDDNEVAEDVLPNKNGFVKEVVTYMIMDDLVITPMSTISSITLLNKFNVKEVGALEEKVVELGMKEGVNLLKASLQSKMVLTNVFIKNKTET
ncbi:hypothetical protein Fmac_022952 [Flemingia macrophylla]|uniref:DUF674 domain-containing protein n=1 Tax=Flemingia macrophylla TaxID=520843 RepID=A0ABD1LK46_9FABA